MTLHQTCKDPVLPHTQSLFPAFFMSSAHTHPSHHCVDLLRIHSGSHGNPAPVHWLTERNCSQRGNSWTLQPQEVSKRVNVHYSAGNSHATTLLPPRPPTQLLCTGGGGIYPSLPLPSSSPQRQKKIMCLEDSRKAVWPSDSLQLRHIKKNWFYRLLWLATILSSLSAATERPGPDAQAWG